MREIDKGAREFNIPISKANRKLVASENGGLQNPSCLIFNPEWDPKETQRPWDSSLKDEHSPLHIDKRFLFKSIYIKKM